MLLLGDPSNQLLNLINKGGASYAPTMIPLMPSSIVYGLGDKIIRVMKGNISKPYPPSLRRKRKILKKQPRKTRKEVRRKIRKYYPQQALKLKVINHHKRLVPVNK